MIGIKHIEFLVSDLRQSMVFYGGVLEIIGWKRVSENGFKVGDTKIYLTEHRGETMQRSLGPRHICFGAASREVVDNVGKFLEMQNARIIRGPLDVISEKYSKGYYTVDFRDPYDYILEVAHSSNSK